jgi:hypothetical protein
MDFTPPLGGSGDAASRDASRGRTAAQRVPTDQLQEMEDKCERLLLIVEALWNVLKEKHGYDDSELIRRIAMVDLRDGKYDHRVAKAPPKECANCGRVLGRRRFKCLFCGEPVAIDPFER